MPVKIWRRKSLLINGTLAVILVAVGVTSYLEIRPTSSSTALVTSTVQQGTVLATVSASGTLEAAQDLGLNFTTGGKVTAIDVKVGQRVKAGQVLAKVDPTSSQDSLEQAQAQLSAAEAELTAAELGETPLAKKVQSDQAAQSLQSVKTAEFDPVGRRAGGRRRRDLGGTVRHDGAGHARLRAADAGQRRGEARHRRVHPDHRRGPAEQRRGGRGVRVRGQHADPNPDRHRPPAPAPPPPARARRTRRRSRRTRRRSRPTNDRVLRRVDRTGRRRRR